MAPSPLPLPGLTEADAIARRAAGQGNNVTLTTSRSYLQILRENLFTFINFVFLAISVVLLSLGRVGDALLVIVVILGGVVVSVIQEMAAKQKLDEIALLTRPQATVVREGQLRSIDPSEIVLGDVLSLQPGDQILVDGVLVGGGTAEVDESLLTGESDAISKRQGDRVYSGTACVSGRAFYGATAVGRDSLAYQLTASARQFRRNYTPLQLELNLVIRIFMLLACFLWAMVAIGLLARVVSLQDGVQRAAVIAGLVPSGLYLTVTLSYALAAVRMTRQRVLIQQANAVESLSNVDVLCLDKTGTLTANRIRLEELVPIAGDRGNLATLAGIYGASVETTNATSDALARSCPGAARSPLYEIPFSSARKWSALAFGPGDSGAADEVAGLYVLGAPEILGNALADPLAPAMAEKIHQAALGGLRVLLMAHTPQVPPQLSQRDRAPLPEDLKPLGLLIFSDELRPQVRETLAGFTQAGIKIKVISGDNPATVTAVATQAGVGAGEPLKTISGAELAQLDGAAFARAAAECHIFGRVAPDQKAKLVEALRDRGDYVAAVGDGVNDVLFLKKANLAIAMESGSKATRNAADLVLLDDSFETLPYTFLEGQRIHNSIRDVLKLFMVRVFCVTLLIFATGQILGTFPMLNKHSAVVTIVAVGLPTFGFPIWAKPGRSHGKGVIRSMLHFTLPATLSLTLVSLAVYLGYLVASLWSQSAQGSEVVVLDDALLSVPRTALVTVLVVCGLMLVPFLKPPASPWVGGERLCGDWRYAGLAGLLLVVFVGITATPTTREFFELALLAPADYAFLGLVCLMWALTLRYLWRSRLLDRFLGIRL
jgi:cation-transporting ATPase E